MRRLVIALFVLSAMALPGYLQAQTDIINTFAGGGPNNLPATQANLNQPSSVAVDGNGNIFIASPAQHRILRVDHTTGVLTVFAGNGTPCGDPTTPCGDGGPAVNAALRSPQAVAVDGFGNVFIADTQDNRVRKVDLTGTITTVAGTGGSGFAGDNGAATNAELARPFGLAFDNIGSYLYIADIDNNRVRRVDGSGIIKTVAGNGAPGFSGDGGPAMAASLNQPMSVALDNNSPPNLYIGDGGNHRVREVDTAGVIRTVVGNGTSGSGGNGGPATSASLGGRLGLALDTANDVVIADADSAEIRKVSRGTINLVAGNGCFGYSLNSSCTFDPTLGDPHNPATASSLDGPQGVAADGVGNILIADTGNLRIRQVDSASTISTLAGNGLSYGGDTYVARDASLNSPQGAFADGAGNIFIADTGDSLIRRVDAISSDISTVAGNGSFGYSGDTGAATRAALNGPTGVAVDLSENVFIADAANQRIREVDHATGDIDTVAGNGCAGFAVDDAPKCDATDDPSAGDGVLATKASLNFPSSVIVDSSGNLFVADTDNHRIRAVANPLGSAVPLFGVTIQPGNIATIAGNGCAGFAVGDPPACDTKNDPTAGDNVKGTSASLNFPGGIALDGNGNLLIADESNYRVRKVDANTGIITTVAGDGIDGYLGDGGAATSGELNLPSSVAVDKNRNLYIADFGNQAIRRVDGTTAQITTVAGTGVLGFSGDNGPAYLAMVANPSGVAVDGAGNLYIADTFNDRVREVTGPGAPSVILSPPSLAFGDQAVGTTSPAQTITVGNPGNALLKISSIVIYTGSGGTSLDFAEADGCVGQQIASGKSCEISVTFTPTSPSATTETLVINDNAEGNSQSVTLTGTGFIASIGIAPTSLDFGQQVVVPPGTASALPPIIVTNTGLGPLTISGVTKAGANPTDFSVVNGCGTSLPPSRSCPITVTFSPTATGLRSAALNVNDDAPGSPQAIGLTGTGTFVGLSPNTLDFGVQLIGTLSTTKSLTLTNDGGSPLNISSIDVTGDFGQSNSCPNTLAPTVGCTINLVFKPSFAGAQVGTLSIIDSDPASPQTATLRGTGMPSTAVLSTTSLIFLNQAIGTTSSAQGLTLTNQGSLPLTVNSVAISGDFAETNNCPVPPATLALNGACAFAVTFTPAAGGARNGSLTIIESADSSPRIVNLTGNGVGPGIGLSQTSISFGFPQEVGTTSAPFPVVLSSNGTMALAVSGIATTGDFSETDNCSSSLAPSATCTVNVTFTPTSAGARSGMLSITDNVGNSPQTIALTGTGFTQPKATVSPTSLIFTSQLVGTSSAAQAVTLKSSGTAALAITNIVASSGFSETDNCSTSLAAGAACTVNVVFTPKVTGTTTGTLTFTDNAATTPQIVNLTGTGIAPAVALAPTSLNFGNQGVTVASAPLGVALTSTGTAPLLIASITTTGDFAETDNCGTSVAPPTTCTINVTFTPTATGARSGTLTVTDSAATSPQTVALSGTGIGPSFSLSQPSLTFANPQGVGTTSGVLPIALTSTSTAPLLINSVTASGDFAVTDNCAAPPLATTSCTINVTFTPTATGARAGTLSIASNIAASPTTVAFSGTGVPGYAMTADRTSATVLKGSDTAVFNISATSQFSFAGAIGLSCSGNGSVTCAFSPGSITAGKNSVLTVSGLAPLPSGSVSLSVIGTSGSQSPSVALTIFIADFAISASSATATVTAGQTATYTLSFQPSGGFNQAISLSCSGAPLAATCAVSPLAVTPDGTNPAPATVTVTTTPLSSAQAPGPFSLRWPQAPGGPPWVVWFVALFGIVICLYAGRRRGLNHGQDAHATASNHGPDAHATRRVRYLFAALVMALMTWAACGGGSSLPILKGTPAGTYTLTVTAVSGSLSHNITLTLNVN